jgi:hypothetical protein
MMPAKEEGLRFSGIELTRKGVYELDGGRRALFIDRSTIERCIIRSGFVAERPLFGFVVGMCLMAFGVVTLLAMLAVFDAQASRMSAGWVAGGGIIAAFGFLLVKHGIRRGFYLALETSSETRKLTIGASLAANELTAFLARAREELGYEIEVEAEVGAEPGAAPRRQGG